MTWNVLCFLFTVLPSKVPSLNDSIAIIHVVHWSGLSDNRCWALCCSVW